MFALFYLVSQLSLAVLPHDKMVLNSSLSSIDPTPHLAYFEDPSNELDVDTIRTLPGSNWTYKDKDSARALNFGFTESSYWLRLPLQNSATETLKLVVHLDSALFQHIDFYSYTEDGQSDVFHLGDVYPFHQRPVDYPTFVIPFVLEPGQAKDVYIRVKSIVPLIVPISLWQQDAFFVAKQPVVFVYGAFLGVLLIMAAYNLCLYFLVRERSYLIYSTFIIFIIGVHSSLDGVAYQWFWPNASAWHDYAGPFFILVGLAVTVQFTREMLPFPKTGFLSKLVNTLSVITIASAMIAWTLPYKYLVMFSGAFTMIVMVGISAACLAMLKRSSRVARLYVFAWTIYFFAVFLKAAGMIGVIPRSVLTDNLGNLSAVLGIVTISLALADRINSERRAKERAQRQSIGHLKRFENIYNNAHEGIFSFDYKLGKLRANPAFMSMMGLQNIEQYNEGKIRSTDFSLPADTFGDFFRRVWKEKDITNQEFHIHSLLGKETWVSISARVSYDQLLERDVLEGTMIDITDRKAFEEQLVHLASHDSLTGFFNRRAFENYAKEKLIAVQNYSETGCLLYLDLDQFKIVNDLCGHGAGDVLLKNLSQRLIKDLEHTGDEHLLARLGGDEFGILLSNVSLERAQKIAEKLRESIENFLFVWEGNRFPLGVSIGLVELFPYHHSVEQVLVMADTACYKAKDQGRNRVYTFVETDQELHFRQLEMQWVSIIKEAIKEDLFFLVFQNIASNHEAERSGHHYEILIRLMNKQGNLCAPNQFLPAAERYALMPNIDRWVVEHYFEWLRDNPVHLDALACGSINLSKQSIGDEEFLRFLMEAFEHYNIPGSKICFEITESMAIANIDNTHAFIDRLHAIGCRFSLDDFGTGFSSYAYLKDLKVDYIKIDGMFIQNLNDDEVNIAMVKSISEIARAIGIETVAEFVENETIRQRLVEIGIDYSQGYHMHKPSKLDVDGFRQVARQT